MSSHYCIMARFMGKNSLGKSHRNRTNQLKESIKFFHRSNISIEFFPSIQYFDRIFPNFQLIELFNRSNNSIKFINRLNLSIERLPSSIGFFIDRISPSIDFFIDRIFPSIESLIYNKL